MISNILNGFLSLSMTVVNWFLTPIYNVIDDIDLGGITVADMLSYVNSLFTTISGVMSWVIDATGIPRVLFTLMFGVYLTCITIRLSIYIVKMIVKWWDRIIA